MVGETLTLEILQTQIEEERQRRIEEHKREVRERGLIAAAGRPLNLFAEGDSWFDYPLSRDTIGWIRAEGTPRPAILNLAHHGDAASQILGVSRRKRIIANLTDPDNGTFDALLFSAGGNDIAGDQFVLWVLKFVQGGDPLHGIDRQRLSAMLGVIQGAYIDLIEIRNEVAPNCLIFLHGYDFAQPTGVGVCNIGPCLTPSLDFRGWTNFGLASQIVKEVLISFDKLLVQLEQQHKGVFYVRTQGVLSPSADWANELHPTEPGFQKIARAFLR